LVNIRSKDKKKYL